MITRLEPRPSPRFTVALTALRDVVRSESLDSADRAYGSAVEAARLAALSSRLGGAKPTGAHPCIARLIRGRCAAYNRDQSTVPPCFAPGTDLPHFGGANEDHCGDAMPTVEDDVLAYSPARRRSPSHADTCDP